MIKAASSTIALIKPETLANVSGVLLDLVELLEGGGTAEQGGLLSKV